MYGKRTRQERKSPYHADVALERIKLGEFCQLFNFDLRQVRYLLKQGHVLAGAAQTPKTGSHRDFGPTQSLYMAIAMLLRQSRMATAAATRCVRQPTRWR
jgi:hypothetical protein